MRRSYLLYLEDILTSTNKILKYSGNYSYEELLKDEMRIDAIIRNFEIIGEASSNIPQEIRDKYPFIEWRNISDFRNVLAHEYFGIDYEIMWEIIRDKLPELQRGIQTILEKER
ncbi:MAG: nucleotidyltransferase [Nitrospirae bacterium RBG_13_41_22]|nr:MAG: nucleotidyltransferase [Nitrospirae bacterium RBG_13_41_22]